MITKRRLEREAAQLVVALDENHPESNVGFTLYAQGVITGLMMAKYKIFDIATVEATFLDAISDLIASEALQDFLEKDLESDDEANE